MSTHRYTAGARTRNVINIADPGGTGTAYSLETTSPAAYMHRTADPSTADDGFKNFHSQRMLHIIIHNNNLKSTNSPTPAEMDISANEITIWGYNSSLGGANSWSPLRLNYGLGTGNTLIFPEVLIPDVIAYGDEYRMIIPIHGIERIAVQLGTSPFSGGNNTHGAGKLDVYLGVNTI